MSTIINPASITLDDMSSDQAAEYVYELARSSGIDRAEAIARLKHAIEIWSSSWSAPESEP